MRVCCYPSAPTPSSNGPILAHWRLKGLTPLLEMCELQLQAMKLLLRPSWKVSSCLGDPPACRAQLSGASMFLGWLGSCKVCCSAQEHTGTHILAGVVGGVIGRPVIGYLHPPPPQKQVDAPACTTTPTAISSAGVYVQGLTLATLQEAWHHLALPGRAYSVCVLLLVGPTQANCCRSGTGPPP